MAVKDKNENKDEKIKINETNGYMNEKIIKD